MTGSHTGSTLRLLCRSLLEPLSGGDGVDDLAVSEGVAFPVEVGLKVAWGADLAGADDEPHPGVVQGRQVGGREHAGVGDDDELLDAVGGLEGLHDGDDRGGLSLVPLPAADLERETMTVNQQAHDDLGVDPPVLGITHPPQIILTLGLKVERGDVVQAQGQTPTGGDVLEQGLGDRLTVAPLPAAPQGAEQGPHADRL